MEESPQGSWEQTGAGWKNYKTSWKVKWQADNSKLHLVETKGQEPKKQRKREKTNKHNLKDGKRKKKATYISFHRKRTVTLLLLMASENLDGSSLIILPPRSSPLEIS